MQKSKSAISVNHVSKSFYLPHEKTTSLKTSLLSYFKKRQINKNNRQYAVVDVSLDIKKGEFFGIVGRNGSGKSTLLKMLAGIYHPSSGKIKVNGRLVPFIELGVGFNGELTGKDNIYLSGALLGFSRAEIDKRYDQIVAFAELERFMDQKLKNYSSGMQVRLAFALAIQTDADILLVDEVLAVGDADFQRKCFSYFKQLKKQNKTVVFVSHDMSAVREYCTRAALINKGKVMKVGSADSISDEYIKLFSSKSNSIVLDSKRTGVAQNTITDTEVKSVLKDADKYLEIAIMHKMKQDVRGPVFGYSIMDTSGTKIVGSNSRIEQKKTGTYKKGDSVQVIWKLPNIFSSGEYKLQAAILDGDSTTILDWWEDCAGFEVQKQVNTPYAVSPQIGFKEIKNNE